MKYLLLSKALALFLGYSVIAQSVQKEKIDSFFHTLDRNQRFMGSVAIWQEGQIVYTSQSGFSDMDRKTRPDTATRYRIGSLSKTFTAVLVFKAIEEGKLKIDDKLANFFPSIKNAASISIGNMLNHTSGIYNFTDDTAYLRWNSERKTESQMVGIIAKGSSVFQPGAKASYSNSNYVLLSFILEKIYKQSYALMLQERIIKPVGLKNTYVGGKIDPLANESLSYTFNGDWKLEKETDMSIPVGAGAIVSTPSDITRFADALFNGKLVSKASLGQMTSLVNNYGMGLFEFEFKNTKGFGHTGGIDGFTSVFCYFPERKACFAFSSNGLNYPYNTISKVLADAIYDRPIDIPVFRTISIPSDTLERYTGVYTSTDLPLTITITRNGLTLLAQATGQPSFPLEALSINRFTFEQAGAVFAFSGNDGTMTLTQGGRSYTFKKETQQAPQR